MTERSEHLLSLFLQDPSAMTEEEARELSDWILQDTRNTQEFIRASLFRRCIHDILLGSDEGRNGFLVDDMETPDTNVESLFDKQLWDVLLKEEATAPRVEVKRSSLPKKELIQNVKHKKVERKINKTTLFAPIISVAAMIVLIVYVTFVPNTVNVEVATLTDSLDAQWAESSAPARNFRLVTNHPPLMLRKGYAELIFDNNSKVVIEAPAEFQVLSYDQIKLTYGRLYATVPQEALGFIVSTPNSKIIDLGTEFGVQADLNGTTELHVTKGKIALVSGSKDHKTNILVHAGSAKKVTSDSLGSISIPCKKGMFIRQIDSKTHSVWRGQNVSLADIVGGGDGFGTGRPDQGIEPLTGNMTESLPRADVYTGPDNYVPVSSNPFVDGVFVPGINPGAVQITSGGLQTDAFPETSGKIWGYIFNGAWHQSDDVSRHHLQLDGATLEGRKNPALTMHSNLGMTFDLSAIRKTLPGMRIQSFSSVFGISQTVEKWIKFDFTGWERTSEVIKLSEERHSRAEFWVFLDGKNVLRQTLSSISKAGKIDLPIDEGVRYLTLAVTESDDTFMFDWGVFARPELILEAADLQPITN